MLLFRGVEGSIDLARAYISVFGRSANGFIRGHDDVSTPTLQAIPDRGVYAFGAACYQLLIEPLCRLLTFQASPFYVLGAAIAFARQVYLWDEALYDFHDPLPFWYFYQIYVPLRLVFSAVRGTGDVLAGELNRMMI